MSELDEAQAKLRAVILLQDNLLERRNSRIRRIRREIAALEQRNDEIRHELERRAENFYGPVTLGRGAIQLDNDMPATTVESMADRIARNPKH